MIDITAVFFLLLRASHCIRGESLVTKPHIGYRGKQIMHAVSQDTNHANGFVIDAVEKSAPPSSSVRCMTLSHHQRRPRWRTHGADVFRGRPRRRAANTPETYADKRIAAATRNHPGSSHSAAATSTSLRPAGGPPHRLNEPQRVAGSSKRTNNESPREEAALMRARVAAASLPLAALNCRGAAGTDQPPGSAGLPPSSTPACPTTWAHRG